MKNLRRGTQCLYKGRKVEVLGVDSDERAPVWVYFLDNPDQDAFPLRSELTLESA